MSQESSTVPACVSYVDTLPRAPVWRPFQHFCNEFSGRSRNRPGAVLTIHTPSCKHVARCALGLRLDTLVQRPIVLVHYEMDLILGFHLVIFHELVTHQPHQLFNFRSRQRSRRQVSGFTFVTTFFVTNFSLLESASCTAEIMRIWMSKNCFSPFSEKY